jgi:hypothetical protein
VRAVVIASLTRLKHAGADARRPEATLPELDAAGSLGYQGALAKPDRAEGIIMAVETTGGHPAMDYAEHTRTYHRFIRATIGMIVFIVLILLFLLTLVP